MEKKIKKNYIHRQYKKIKLLPVVEKRNQDLEIKIKIVIFLVVAFHRKVKIQWIKLLVIKIAKY